VANRNEWRGGRAVVIRVRPAGAAADVQHAGAGAEPVAQHLQALRVHVRRGDRGAVPHGHTESARHVMG